MKRKLSFITSLLLLISPTAFAAQTVNVGGSPVTLILPSDGSTYVLTTNSKFDTLTVNSDNFSFGLVDGSIVEITSSDKKKLTNSLGIATVCQADNSYVSLSLTSPPSSTTTETVTPSGNACTGAGGGSSSGGGGSGSSGGGGGGGGGTIIITPAPSSTPGSTHVLTPTPSGNFAPKSIIAAILATLAPGSKGEEVKVLQQYLGVQVSGLYGPATKAAVQKFQEKYGIVKKGQSGYGTVGPKTREKLNLLMQNAKASAFSPPPTNAPSIANVSQTILHTLASGSKGEEVKAIQQYLGVQVSGLYGPATKAAVQKFQEKYGIVKKGQSGYGTVGPKTREKLNALMNTIGVSSKQMNEEEIKNQIESIQKKIDQMKSQ